MISVKGRGRRAEGGERRAEGKKDLT